MAKKFPVDKIVDCIVAIPQELCLFGWSDTAQFCLDVARKKKLTITKVLIIGTNETKIDFKSYETIVAPAEIDFLSIDKKRWPLDVGNNDFLKVPLTLYAGLRKTDFLTIVVPLFKGAGYFLHMAKNAGLKNENTKIITTCFQPRTFELQGNLILPKNLSDVIDTELEQYCASHSDELWVSHNSLIEKIRHQFKIPNSNKVLAFNQETDFLPTKFSNKSELVFIGEASLLYGFDLFCDLAKQFEESVDRVIVSIFNRPKDRYWLQSGKAILDKISCEVSWVNPEKIKDQLSDKTIHICPMRAPIFPQSAKLAKDNQSPLVRSIGHTLGESTTAADIRKLGKKLGYYLDHKAPQISAEKPILITPPKPVFSERKTRNPIKTISIVLLHHNRIEKLKDALKSLENQSFKEFELIIVDDGSEQKVVEKIYSLVKEFQFTDVSVTAIQNSYPSAARNHGVMTSKSEAIFFMDDDNVLDPLTIEHFFRAIQNNDLVLSFYQIFSDPNLPVATVELGNMPSIKSRTYAFAGLLPGAGRFFNIMGNSHLMIRKEVFISQYGFSNKFGIGLEDYDFLLRLSTQDEIQYVVLPEPYLFFRVHPNRIRNNHIDWKRNVRLQGGQWRLYENWDENTNFSEAYARQLHEIMHYQFIASPRPKYFRLKSIFLHQYIRPFLARNTKLRSKLSKFTSQETRFGKVLEKLFF